MKKSMYEKDEELLLKEDLSARLHYGVFCHINDFPTHFNPRKLIGIEVKECDSIVLNFLTYNIYYPSISRYLSEIKPYLRPMFSMTEEERKEYELLANRCITNSVGFIHFDAQELINWLDKNMFDHRGLIPKGLAIEVTESNDPYKK